jgi:protein-serine/threonine kinase
LLTIPKKHERPLNFPLHPRHIHLPDNTTKELPLVSSEAMHLINRLLSPKQFRLCSDKYRQNEPKSKRRLAYNPETAIPNAYFVFDDDASDIKCHPFFRGIKWDEFHLQCPPFIPQIRRDDSITRYFEDEKDILGSWTGTGLSENDERQSKMDMPPAIVEKLNLLKDNPNPVDSKVVEDVLTWLGNRNPQVLKSLFIDPTKRARDKILRDRKSGKTALQIRKRYAFLGYTYRRSHHYANNEYNLLPIV